MTNKFIRSHNSIPLGFSVFTLVTIIFFLGMLYNRFLDLEQSFVDYKITQEKRYDSIFNQFVDNQKSINDLDKTVATLSDRLPAVRGASTRIASSSASLVVPSPTKVPTPTRAK